MKKRLFQILDDMNVYDADNGTRLVAACYDFVSANKSKQGALITMGAPEEILHGLMDKSLIPVLVMIDKEEYKKRAVEVEKQ